jgi:hypothetical protein
MMKRIVWGALILLVIGCFACKHNHRHGGSENCYYIHGYWYIYMDPVYWYNPETMTNEISYYRESRQCHSAGSDHCL